MARYALDSLIDCGTRLLTAKGLSADRARPVARAQVEVHAFGVTTHGLTVLLNLVDRVGDDIDPAATPATVHDTGAVAAIDGRGRLSVECLQAARDVAGDKARQFGVGFVSAVDCGWAGALGYHLSALAREGLLAMAWAQTSNWTGVAPFGGREARLGTNPLALSFPAGDDPAVADFSTSVISNGKVRRWRRSGHRPPEPMFLDAQGRPSDDPGVMGEEGTILPFGGLQRGFRGTMLALWAEALTAAAGGRPTNADGEGGQNLHVLCLDPAALAGRDHCEAVTRKMIEYVLSSAPAPGRDGPTLAGRRGWRALAHARHDGLDLDDHAAGELRRRCQALGVPLPEEMPPT